MAFTPRLAPATVFELFDLDQKPGICTFRVRGKGAKKIFKNESGGHQWQRVPPTEKRGRVQTSTITVAILDKEYSPTEISISDSDIEKWYTRGSGPGGQHRNKVETVCVLKHIPTGIQIRSESHKSRWQNEQAAYKILEDKLQEIENSNLQDEKREAVKDQVGFGTRGDRRRTYREKDDQVHDFQTGKKVSLKKIMKGELKRLA